MPEIAYHFVAVDDDGTPRLGYGDGRAVVVGRDGSPVTVDSLQVLSAADKRALPVALQVPAIPATAALAPEKLATILDYLKKAYGGASEAMIDRFRELTTKAA
jgi:hypothetical protein